jgi:DNA-binding NtrC family response regulator
VVPVGGSKSFEVDVRIIACTNRDLAAEVNAGRFREDLYHRLAVIRLEIPPLRRRRADILPLAQHFLEFFSTLHSKEVRRLAPEAETRLLEHSWNGNVRELRNCMQRAVILSPFPVLAAQDLSLETDPPEARTASPAPETEEVADEARVKAAEKPSWPELEEALDAFLESLPREQDPVPLGQWLQDELVLQAQRRSGEVGRRSAALLGIPETTLRRRIPRARSWVGNPVREDERQWHRIQVILDAGIQKRVSDTSLLAAADDALLAVLERRFPGDIKTCAAFLGVSLPTCRRRLQR